MNMRVLVLCVVSFGAVNGCFGYGGFGLNSILNTAERNTAANALVVKSPQTLKKLYEKAAAIAKGNQVAFKVLTGATLGLLSPVFAPYFVLAGRRARMYRSFAKHADVINALLQSPEFKKHMGVTDWDEVRRIRRRAETAGIMTQFLATLPAAFLAMIAAVMVTQRATNDHSTIDAAALAAFGGTALFGFFGLKPIIAKAIRKKGGAPTLEREFEKAIKIYKKTGVLPYGATLDTSKPAGGTVSSATYQDAGMQSTSYAVESARDKYLRILAERAEAKQAAAQEASESAQD